MPSRAVDNGLRPGCFASDSSIEGPSLVSQTVDPFSILALHASLICVRAFAK